MPDNQNLTVITTHMNADFDALASLLAAQKLYPDSLVVFPGSQEKNLRNFFIDSMAYLFNLADIKDIEFDQVKRLVLVDTRNPGRIGKFAELLKRTGIEVHIFDHHPQMDTDIKGEYEVIESTGATVTILTEMIKERAIALTPDEATIMCLGIYEDTGSFTFSSTTEKDFLAAAFLISKGANLNVVSNLISREISPEQVGLLNDIIQAATHYNIHGASVVITSVSSENYVPDFAFIVHKMVKMENLDVIFAIASMGSKIYIVARSRIPEVDVGAILTPLGGGGHPFAAAATIKENTLVQIEHQLLEILNNKIRSRNRAKDLMSSPPIAIEAAVSCRQAGELMTRYNINALLVTGGSDDAVKKDKLVGVITRQIIEKTHFHNLDRLSVREYMTTEISSVGPDADLEEIQEKIIDSKQRILPVIDNGVIIGVVTRTDLLKIMVRESKQSSKKMRDLHHETAHARTRNVIKFMKERISNRIMTTLRRIGEVADQIGGNTYVVGGFVRDLFLYRANEDIDIVVEGDGIFFAKKFAEIVGARIHAYDKFGTAVIIFPDGYKIDVASARLEYYQFPAALPTVEMSSLKLDLFRRDFTINTLAIQLNPETFGTLIDFFAAQKDIKEKAVRVLHNLSFVEDPTRIFRAVRFEQRFGFTIGKPTAGLIENAVKMNFMKRVGGRRIFSELMQVLKEENPIPALIKLNDYDLLKGVHPAIKLDKDRIELLSSIKMVLNWHDLLFLEESYMKWAVYFLALIWHVDKKTTEEIASRLELAPRYRKFFCVDRIASDTCLSGLERNLPVKNSTLYKQLSIFSTELILYMMAATKKERVKRSISQYFTQLRHVKTSIRGKDLMAFGIEPGPVYKEILQAVLDARLNGLLKSRSEELSFVRDYAS
ncbi:MAG: CBS domain-containing protein [Pseudomonadota bacterium]